MYNGLVDVYKKTLKTDGIVGLYRGFVISCVGIIVYRGCYFGLYDTLKPMILGDSNSLMASFALGYGKCVLLDISLSLSPFNFHLCTVVVHKVEVPDRSSSSYQLRLKCLHQKFIKM